MENQIAKIGTIPDESKLLKDLERYKEKAIELGAVNARTIKTEEIPVDERVTLKCQIPRCFGYGNSAHCPPNTMKAVGINVYKMTASSGWDIYPIGSHAKAEDTPNAVLAGLVVVE